MVSCIIPVRNRRYLIGDAIKSVLMQPDDIPVEIVVVDDGSSDGTPEYVRETFPWVNVVESRGGCGPGVSRNLGVENTSGSVLMFLDSDDQWLPGHVSELVSLLGSGFHVAYGVTLNTDSLNNDTFLLPEENQAPCGWCYEYLLRWCFLVPSSVAVTRHAFETSGRFSGLQFGEDWEFFLRLGSRFQFAHTRRVITRRLLHRDSLCASENIGEKIVLMLEDLIRLVIESKDTGPCVMNSRAVDAAVKRFRQMAALAVREGEQWQTVQDWYMSLKRHGLA